MVEERRQKIMELLKKDGKVLVEKLSKQFTVSTMTIRRDLQYLEDAGLAYRTYGGAIIPNLLKSEKPYKEKKIHNLEEKNKIGCKAVSFISEGDAILLDAGTTCLAVAQNIKQMKNITVITNDLRIALEIYKNPDIELIITGGTVQPDTGAMIGSKTDEFISSINVDIAFLGIASIDYNLNLWTPTAEKALLKKRFMQHSNTSVLLADHSKFGERSLHKICNLDSFDIVIS